MQSNEKWPFIGVKISGELLAEVDAIGRLLGESRSEFVRASLIERIERATGKKVPSAWIVSDRRGKGGRPTHKASQEPPVFQGNPSVYASGEAPALTENAAGQANSKSGIDPADPVALFHAAMPLVEQAWERAGLVSPPGKKGKRRPPDASLPPPGTGLQTSLSPKAPKLVRAARGPSGS